jgi:thiol:disulfide interchange protein DsbA
MTRLAWLAAVSCLIFTACGQQSPKTPEASPAAQTETPASAVAKPAPAATKPAGANNQPAEVVNAGEDLETVDTDQSPAASPSPLLAAALEAAPAATVPGPWKENVNYTRLIPAQPTVNNVPSGQVEVAEVFWYGCPHCYALDPLVESWRKTKPSYIAFVRAPGMWNEGLKLHARLFYTLMELKKLEELHSTVFNEIHQHGNPLMDRGGDEEKSIQIQAQFAARYGINPADYIKAAHSYPVDQQMTRAEQLNRAYMITSVPTFIINGKYWTDVGHAGGEKELFALLNDLAAAEKRGR